MSLPGHRPEINPLTAVWRLVLRTPYKCACCKYPRWSSFRRFTTLARWASKWTLSREFSRPRQKLITRLIFPRWDVIAIILSIFLLTYTYIEARSNYHRGSILVLAYVYSSGRRPALTSSYIVLIMGFYYAPARQQGDNQPEPMSIDALSSLVFDAKEAVPRFAAGLSKLWA